MSRREPLIIVTATFAREGQLDYLRRCAEALAGIDDLLWILVEDASQRDERIDPLAREFGLNLRHLHVGPVGDMGNSPKNRAFKEIADQKYEGVVYVADDDNLYDKKLFDILRQTKRVSVFPVGNLGPSGVERPVVIHGRIVGWVAGKKTRKYPLDWAGFAVHTRALSGVSQPVLGWKRQAPYPEKELFLNKTIKEKKDLHSVYCEGESDFLEKIIGSKDELEILCDHCTKCHVWYNQPLGSAPPQPVFLDHPFLMSVPFVNALRLWLDESCSRGSIRFLMQRLVLCVLERRLPRAMGLVSVRFALAKLFTTIHLHIQTKIYLRQTVEVPRVRKGKSLFACAVGRRGVPQIIKIIRAFGFKDFDYWFFVWDDTPLDDPIFKQCRVIYEKGLKWHFMKKYLTPEAVRQYDYILPWDDDLELVSFKPEEFFRIFERNRLEMAQPALSKDSEYNHFVTVERPNSIGQYTDYCEVMAQVFRLDAWEKYWDMMEKDTNHWGWGYDDLARSLCQFRLIGIIDCQTIRHIRPAHDNSVAFQERQAFVRKHASAKEAFYTAYLKMK